MCIGQTYLPLLFPNSSIAPYQSPWQPHAHFPFYYFVSKLPLWDPPVLPIRMWLCGCLLGNKQSSSGHIPQREWFPLPQQTSTADRFSDMGRTSEASPPTMLDFFFSLKVQVLGMSLWLLCVDARNSCVRKRNNTLTLSSSSAGSYLHPVFTGVSLSCGWWEVGQVKILICWALKVIYTLSFDQLRISALRNTHCKMSISEWGWEKHKPVGINVPIYNSVGSITI